MKIIAGLGNPGREYEQTRHNAGFIVLRAIADKHGIEIKKKAFGGVYGFGKALGRELALFEPQTYMNLSGEAVNAICSGRLEDRKDLLVISDDVALPFGSLRIRKQGSSGGHNGLRSIIQFLGDDFARLRVGVGKESPVADMKDYVLSRFTEEEREQLTGVVARAVECAEEWMVAGINKAMAGYNQGKPRRESPV
jgi:peptidyl-tRNA hydrolase, PTH1 family